MLSIVILIIMMVFLFIAACQDFKTGMVKDLYPLSISIVITGLFFSFLIDKPFINIKTNIIIALIVFMCNYIVYILSNMLNRYGWGGADVLILSSLTCGLGFYIIIVVLISTFLSIIYTILKAFVKKENVFKVQTKFLPFVFIATCISLYFIIIF